MPNSIVSVNLLWCFGSCIAVSFVFGAASHWVQISPTPPSDFDYLLSVYAESIHAVVLPNRYQYYGSTQWLCRFGALQSFAPERVAIIEKLVTVTV